MEKMLILLIGLGILSSLSCKRTVPDGSFSFDKIYYYAIQEDVKKIVVSINKFPEDSLTDDQKELKSKYNNRFLTHSEKITFNTNDSHLNEILTTFHNYWSEILMKESSVRKADQKYRKILIQQLTSISNSGNHKIEPDKIQFDFRNAIRSLLKENGYFNRLDRTGNIMDLIIWTKQTEKIYDVNLEDTVLKVPVVHIDSVLSYGWEGFATFDHFYPGGWTSPDTLFCITKDYDLSSEKFIVSYLTHESKHLLDAKIYINYPKWVAEYRAKLAELSVADSTLYNLLNGFIKGQKNDSRLTHPYAEYVVISELSKELLNEDFETDLNIWKKIPQTDINIVSKRLLKENSLKLKLK